MLSDPAIRRVASLYTGAGCAGIGPPSDEHQYHSEASTREHVLENRAALNVHLTEEDLVELAAAFPPPTHKLPLDVI